MLTIQYKTLTGEMKKNAATGVMRKTIRTLCQSYMKTIAEKPDSHARHLRH